MNLPRRLMLLLVVVTLVVAACSDEPQPQATPDVTAIATEVPSPPAPTPSVGRAPGPVEPLRLLPVDESTLVEVPYIFDTTTGRTISRGTATFADAIAAFPQFVSISVDPQTNEGTRAFYDKASRAWFKLDVKEEYDRGIELSADGRIGVMASEREMILFDLVARTQRRLGISGTQVSFSPDGRMLAFRNEPPREDESPYVIYPIANPAGVARLPLGRSPESNYPFGLRWLDNSRVLLMNQNVNLLQVFDVSGPPRIVLEETVESDQTAVSPDGTHIAVQIRPADRTVDIALYKLMPFQRLGTFPDAVLSSMLDVKSGVWASDNSRLLGVRARCKEGERLMSYALSDAAETKITSDEMMTYVYSPDGRWVAYTAWAREGYVIDASGSGPPAFVSDNVSAPSTPVWSDDSRYVAFTPYHGGYDRCT